MPNSIALYVHVPFCRTKCSYCDFYSLASPAAQEPYVRACVEHLHGLPHRWSSVYVGGGTPSCLPPHLLESLLTAAVQHAVPGAEVTCECNPTSLTAETAAVLRACGVNRVSLGLQSLHTGERRALGRQGTRAHVEQALQHLRRVGMARLSLDVMLGIAGQTAASLRKTLQFCASEAGHVSAYLLTLEPGTPLQKQPPHDLPNEEAQCDFYLQACEELEAQGLQQYEVSNFARAGQHSRHNLHYWHCGEYVGLGSGAHGFTQGRRWHYARNLSAFLQGTPPQDDGPGGDPTEQAMLALRLTEGIANPSPQLRTRAAPLAGMGLVELQAERVALTRRGFLLSNQVIQKLIQ